MTSHNARQAPHSPNVAGPGVRALLCPVRRRLLCMDLPLTHWADLLISEAQATRRIARQVLRLARSMVGDYTSADVGSDI